MADENKILLNLIISGQDAGELRRLAEQTQGRLNSEIKAKLDELTAQHKKADDEITRGHERAAKQVGSSWQGTLQVMANVAISTRAAYDVITGGLGRFKALGDEIDRLTNVYGSLKGSIDEMRESTHGEVSDFDLIVTKNRALEKELKLTDQQFGALAAAADHFADVTGTDTKQALDQLVDGLAQGRLKTLAAAGVVIDATAAQAAYAKSIGVATDQLNEHGKKMAVIQAALDELTTKQNKNKDVVDDFAHKWEKMTAEVNNTTDSLKLFVGTLAVDVYDGLTKGLPFAFSLGAAKIKDIITGGTMGFEKALLDKIGHENDSADMLDKMAKQANGFRRFGQDINPDDFLHPGGKYDTGDRRDSINQSKIDSDAKAAAAEALRRQKSADSLDAMFRKGSGIGAQSLGDEATTHQFESPAGLTAALGAPNTFAMMETIRKAQMAKAEADEKDQQRQAQDAADAMAKVNEDAMNEMMDKADKLRERAGNGIFATLLFGPSGREELLDDIDAFKNTAADAMGMVSDTAMKMAEALGASLAAFVSGDKNKRKSIRDTTHDILEALAAQAYARAIFETAEGLASLALGPIGGASAGAHFAAAGMFTAVGTAAGLGSRAIGQSAQQPGKTSGSSSGAGTGTGGGLSSSGSGFGSNGTRSSGGGGGDQQQVNIYVNAPLGDRAEIGRGINMALAEYFSQSGRGVNVAAGSV